MKGFEYISIEVGCIFQKLENVWCFCIIMADYLGINTTYYVCCDGKCMFASTAPPTQRFSS